MFFSGPLQEWSQVFYEEDSPSIYSFDDIPAIEFCIIIYSLRVFHISVLADGFSLEFEWQQVSSSLQDSSEYSGRSQ